jgi:UDP-glucose 4-epimerase
LHEGDRSVASGKDQLDERVTMTKHILVTGGAGYVGSHVVAHLVDQGAKVVVLDNLKQGHRAAVPAGTKLVECDVGNALALEEVFKAHDFDTIFHFASLSLVGESMREPFRYLEENGINSLRLIDAACRHGCRRFILSSTANLFGTPRNIPISEDAPIDPGSPYGESKYFVERALKWADRIFGLRSACLRYFNAAGADPGGQLGEDHDPETHLIPLLIDAALDRRSAIGVFGTDYDTRDGTCIRDYVHVSDLATAHVAAMSQLTHRSVTYNVGSGGGHSVREVAAAVERVSGRRVPLIDAARRQGDPAILVARSDLLRKETAWTPRMANLHDIVETAYRWRLDHPLGYND